MKTFTKQSCLAIAQSEYFSFFGGGLLGIILFLFLYGASTLDVTNVDWLLQKGDLSQHYIGWCFYRNSDWLFPIGLANTLSYPLTSSVIYTDSIPILAVFFKLFRNILPDSFQYFGWFTFIVYFLQGAISALLVHRLTGNAYYGILSACLFLLFAPLQQRSFAHTALSAHFLLLLSLLVLLTRKHIEHTWSGIAIWSFILSFAAGIHFFFMPMVGCCLLLYAIKVKLTTHKWWPSLITLFIPIGIAFLSIWQLGGLSSDVTVASQISTNTMFIHQYSANLNTFINPLSYIPSSPFQHTAFAKSYPLQYEGFGYLGIGVLLGSILLIPIFSIYYKNAPHKIALTLKKTRVWMLLSLTVIFFLLAASPSITWGDRILFTYPIWHPIEKIWSIFRSTGRFIWMPAYIIILTIVVCIYRFNKKPCITFGILLILVCLQFAEIVPNMKLEASNKIEAAYIQNNGYNKLNILMDNKKHIIFSAYYYHDFYTLFPDIISTAIQQKATLNAFYFARYFNGYFKKVTAYADSAMRNPSEDCLYVLVGGMPDTSSDLHLTLNIQQIGTYVIGIKKEKPPTSQSSV